MAKTFKKTIAMLIAVLMIVTTLPFSAVSAQASTESYEVFGNVTIDPIIYVHGSDYMYYGSTVADGSVTGECSTNVSSKKTIASIEVTDTNATLSVTNGKLTGDLGGGYGTVKTYTTESTATLKFVFADGTYEYHRLPVKPNPVASHTLSVAFNYYGSPSTKRYSNAFESLAIGSYGYYDGSVSGSTSDYTTGDSSISDTGASKNKTYNQSGCFASMYAPYNTSYGCSENDSKITINGVLSPDKKAGYIIGWENNTSKTGLLLSTTAPTATYYLDLSLGNQQGITHTKDSTAYSIQFLIGGLYFKGSFNSKTLTYNSETTTKSKGDNSTLSNETVAGDSANDSDKTYTTKLSGTASVGTTWFNHVIRYDDSNRMNNQVTTPIQLVVTNKKTQRDQYATIISEASALKQSCYTDASWESYRNAILTLEEWLNDNTDTSDGSALVTAVSTAKSKLTPNSDASAHTVVTATTPATCTASSTEKYTCQYCSWTGADTHNTSATGHKFDYNNGVHTDATLEQKGYTTYTCSICGETEVVYDENDWTTYDSTVAEYESIISASDYAKKYTDSSKAEYEATVKNAKLDKTSDSVTQVAINNAIATILEAKAVLEEKQGLTVTVSVVADDNNDIDVDSIVDLTYGDTVIVDLTDSLAGYTITKWTIVQDNATSKLAMADKTYEMVVTGDTDITVYVSKTPEDTTNYKKVIVIDRNEKKLGTAYIEKAQDVDLTVDKIAGIEAPSLAFYEFKAWEVLTNSDNSIMVKATYTAPGVSCNVHFLDGLSYNGVSEYEAYYDETLSVDTDAKLAIATKADKSDAVAIANNDSIHTPKSNDAYIFIVKEDTTLASTAITGVYYHDNTASFNMIYSLPEGAELVECGGYVIRSAEENTSGFDFNLADAFKIRSQSQSSNGEYTISAPSSNGFAGYKTVYAKSYVVYVLDGQQFTQYSNAVGVTVN